MKQKFLKFFVPLLSVLVILTVVLCSTFSCFSAQKIGEFTPAYIANKAYPMIGNSKYIQDTWDNVYSQLQSGMYNAIGYFITPAMVVPANSFRNYDSVVIKGLNPDGLINTGNGVSIDGYFYEGNSVCMRYHLTTMYSSNGVLVLPISGNFAELTYCVFSIRAYNREVLVSDIQNCTIYLDNKANYSPDVSTTTPPELLYPAVDMWNAEIEALPSVFQNVTNAYYFENRFTTFGLVLISVVGLGIISAIIALILKICRGDK